MTTATKKARTKPATREKAAEFYTYLLDFNTQVIAFIAQNVSQDEAKRVAAEIDCGHNQMIVVSHQAWDWKVDEVNECFLPITINKMTA